MDESKESRKIREFKENKQKAQEFHAHPVMDADYALIEQIASVVDGDFIGPLQGIASRLKEIFYAKILSVFVFDTGFKQFVELAYSIDRNLEKMLLINEIDINPKSIIKNFKNLFEGSRKKAVGEHDELFNTVSICSYTGHELENIFSDMIDNRSKSKSLLLELDIKRVYTIPIMEKTDEYISFLFMFMDRELALDEIEILGNYYKRQLDLVVKHIIDVKGLFMKATHDELTGLYMRRFGKTSLAQYINLVERKNLDELSLLFIDIDHFKDINDSYGHKKGDQVLTVVGRAIMDAIRNTDIPLRYGGEELCVILPNADIDVSRMVARRIRNDIKALSFDSAKSTFSITVSIGLLKYDNENHLTVDEFFDEADKLMYRAKKTGRDRICYREKDGSEHFDLGEPE
ncbi:MAG: GGDEF domain-containing protein [bacterium]|nr:GGDEF domain-containing protein [bacterium]